MTITNFLFLFRNFTRETGARVAKIDPFAFEGYFKRRIVFSTVG